MKDWKHTVQVFNNIRWLVKLEVYWFVNIDEEHRNGIKYGKFTIFNNRPHSIKRFSTIVP